MTNKEKEILPTYHAYWDAYLRGDMKTFASFLDKDVHIFGSSQNDIFQDKKSALAFYTATADQISGKTELRNREIKVLPQGDNIMVHEQSDFYFSDGKDWHFYGHARLSTLFKKKKEGWKITHQHGSLPDAKTEEGEQLAAGKIEKENLQLREAVKRRTVELDNKNRELEVEAALERVRAIAMAMNKPEDLSTIAEVVFTELTVLGFSKLRNSEVIITNSEKETIQSYDYSNAGIAGPIEVDYTSHPTLKKWAKTIKKADDAFAFVHIKQKEIADWRKYRKQLGYKNDPKLNRAKEVFYYSYSTGMGALSISSFKPITKKQLLTLERFKNVFGLAYRRYLDVVQAQAQAREAQIEAALERVRAKSMAMHTSENLLDTISEFFTQLKLLDVVPVRCGVAQMLTTPPSWIWTATHATIQGDSVQASGLLTNLDHPVLQSIYDNWVHQENYFPVLKGKDLADYYKVLRGELTIPEFTKGEVHFGHYFNFKEGNVFAWTTEPLRSEEVTIFERFSLVLSLTYRRYLDLQKAEEQTREAKIEAALERARTQSMLMQHSDELYKTSEVFHEQMHLLGIESEFSYLWLPDEKNAKHLFWATWQEGKKKSFRYKNNQVTYPLDKTKPDIAACYVAWESGVSVHVNPVKPKDVKAYFNSWPELLNGVEKFKPSLFPDGLYYVDAYMKYGCFGVMIRTLLSEEQKQVLHRFSKEFERAYTRFLDLQKAEEQAREAQIEAALERVRAASMAMHASDDLKDVVRVIFDQLGSLDINAEHAGIVVDYKPKSDWHFWIAETQDIPAKVSVPYLDIVWDRQFTKAKKNDQEFFTTLLNFKQKNSFYAKLLPHIKGLTRKAKNFYLKCSGLAISTSIQEDVALYIENFAGTPYTDEENEILKRFTKVFQQTYTRFLDLKKAEEQAKEAKIEAALERVRSRSLAMHQSDELGEVIALVVERLNELGFYVDDGVALITFTEGSKDLVEWMANPGFDSATNFRLPHFDHPVLNNIWQAKERHEAFVFKRFSSEENQSFLKHIFKYSEFKSTPEDVKKYCLAADTYATSMAIQKNTAIFINDYSGKDLTLHEIDTLKRFSKVFEQAYTRFLDLQKAEKQAKEALIEASMERIRAASLAMHQSSELLSLIQVISTQLDELGVRFNHTSFGQNDQLEDYIFWTSVRGQNEPFMVHVPRINHPMTARMKKVRKENLSFYTDTLTTSQHDRWNEHMLKHNALPKLSKKQKNELKNTPFARSLVVLPNIFLVVSNSKGLPFSDQENDIIKRVASVFEQAYVRFLDLQKAEAQAREAQIEAALERVRSRSMGMQRSEELQEVILLIYDQMSQLGVRADSVQVEIFKERSEDINVWVANEFETYGSEIAIKDLGFDIVKNFIKDRRAGKEDHFFRLEKKSKDRYYDKAFKETDFKFLPKEKKELIRKGDFLTVYAVFMKKTGLQYIAFDRDNFSSEEKKILKRFSEVFDQFYIRFLDLKKAETQAREAQVELSLERVRAQVTAMQESSDLFDIVVSLRKEFLTLGHEADYFWHMRWLPDAYDMSMTSEDGNRVGMVISVPKFVHEGIPDLANWEKGQEPICILPLNADAAWDYIENMNTHGHYELADPNAPTQEDIQHIGGLTFIIARTTHGEIGYSLPGEVSAPPKDALDTLERFASVFDLAYKRFEDLQATEHRHREAQVELALERVRSRSMAMHSSGELAETALVLFEQLRELGVAHERTNIGIVDEANRKIDFWLTTQKGHLVDKTFSASINESNTLETIYAGYKDKKKSIVVNQKGAELKKWISFITDKLEIPYNPPTRNERRVQTVGYISHGMLIATSTDPLNDESLRILERFAAVFDQTYTRFLDLQKAEEQAREAQIEAVLERVRSRTMAMQHSDEMPEVANNLFNQVQELGFPAWSAGYCIWEENKTSAVCSMSSEGVIQKSFSLPTIGEGYDFATPLKNGDPFYVAELGGKPLVKHYEFMRTLPVVSEIFDGFIREGIDLPTFQIFHIVYFKHGYLMFITYEPVPEAHDIFKRFAAVFDQTYTRFLDLKKAEEQARETQIELSLERIRAQATSMKASSDLLDIVVTMRTEFVSLGYEAHFFWHMRWLPEKYEKAMTGGDGSRIGMVMSLPRHIHGDIELVDTWEKGEEPSLVFPMNVDTAVTYVDKMINLGDFEQVDPNAPTLDDVRHIGGLTFIMARTTHGEIGYSLPGDVPNPPVEAIATLTRFAGAFDLAYRRFEDLRKAEAQAREAQIEVAIEKVRNKAIAMRSSNELADLVITVFQELQGLDMVLTRCLLWVFNEKDNSATAWMTNSEDPNRADYYYVPYHKHPAYKSFIAGWESKTAHWQYNLKGKSKDRWDEILVDGYFKKLPNKVRKAMKDPDQVILSGSFNKYGVIQTAGLEPLSSENQIILERFSQVFEQSYTRFQDLVRAEALAKEAQIEAALERVRARSMAMHHTKELWNVINVVSQQFELLDIAIDNCFINIFEEGSNDFNIWIAAGGETYPEQVRIPYINNAALSRLAKARKKGEEFYAQDLDKKTKDEFFHHFFKNAKNVKVSKKRQNLILRGPGFTGSVALSNHASITISNYRGLTYSQDENEILERISRVFEQTYSRFLDLQKAEAREKEAIKQASLDRVRAEIASMRKTKDLERITPLLWQELMTLAVPFFRCGVFIVNEKEKMVHAYLSTPSGTSLAALHLPFDDTNIPLVASTVEHWRSQESYAIEWSKKEFIETTQLFLRKGQIADSAKFQAGEAPPEKLVLQLVPFAQGMLYAGSTEPLIAEHIDLIKDLADAFAVAYARYEDFVKLEGAKKKVENTLRDLKSAQNQLVHAEKMASLGELTAGIAHEIQNPLNFVNNFSEVNKELMEELQEELTKGDMEEVKAIAQDIMDNDAKIVHHGKRAEGIVKGMLQHSRTSSGEKELTDINVLADEYLRLSYHGLRAKDKSFNADFKLALDEGLPKINVVPQDMGRVLLNLINNAFHAVKEVDKPTVIVKTKALKDKIEITVADNGSGIPDDIKDKIFQPFFTTKATGEGTGLGLSLSYDIVTKGHNGTLVVESSKKGTIFNIELPIIE